MWERKQKTIQVRKKTKNNPGKKNNPDEKTKQKKQSI